MATSKAKLALAAAGPQIDIHPAAAIFPLMSDTELAELWESIKTHGMREPIQCLIESGENKTNWTVLDGRNRLEALRRYGKLGNVEIIEKFMKPVSLAKLGNATPAEYVLMANIERRNLTAPQRKSLAGELMLMIQEGQRDLPKDQKVDAAAAAAKLAGVSTRTAAASAAAAKAKPPAPQTSPADPKDAVVTPTPPVAPRPAAMLGRLTNVVDAVKDSAGLAKWDKEAVKEANSLATVVVELTQLDLDRRLFDARREAEELIEALNREKAEKAAAEAGEA